jgi:hypothetical protein
VFGWLADFYHTEIVAEGKEAFFLLLMAFLGSFGFIRTSARLMRSPKVTWWPGSVKTASGLHIHHVVWGLGLMVLCGFIGFAIASSGLWMNLCAIGFGIGVGLVLDEFALVLHLEDVYWSEEGRASIDAVIVVAIFAALVILVGDPFEIDQGAPIVGLIIYIAIVVFYSAVTFLKGKLILGILGVFIPIFGIVGAIRLGKPNSPWAHWMYKVDPPLRPRGPLLLIGRKRLPGPDQVRWMWTNSKQKHERSVARYVDRQRRSDRLFLWFSNLIGGKPSLPSPEAPEPTGTLPSPDARKSERQPAGVTPAPDTAEPPPPPQ